MYDALTRTAAVTAGVVAGAVGLAVVGAGLVGLAALTARRPERPVPDLDGFYDRWSGLHGGYDPRSSRFVRGWLAITHAVARPLARRGVQPDVVTLLGVWLTGVAVLAASAGGRWPLVAAVVLVLSGLVDNLDGCVAALTDRATPFGYVLDSVVDRLCDGGYLVALWLLGGQPGLCVGAGAAVVLLEYVRARAGNAGFDELGVVTVGERPARVIVSSFALLAAGLGPAYRVAATDVGAAVLLGLSLIGLVQLGIVIGRALRAPAE